MAAAIAERPAQPYREGGYALRTVEVADRRSGRPLAVPLTVAQLGGARYLVSPHRDRSWARNLLASGECELVAGGVRERYRAALLPDDEAVPVLRRDVGQLSFAAARFPFAADAPEREVLAGAGRTAVFRLDPVG
jgi:hypothetical protein